MCREIGVLRLVAPLLAQDDTPGEGDFGRGVEVEGVGETVFGFEVDGRCGLVGVIRTGGPLVGLEQVAGRDVQYTNEAVGALEFDHVGGEGLGELSERRLHSEHRFERRELQVEALAAGAILGHAHEPGTVPEVMKAKVTVGDGGGVADAAVVVNVSASFVFGHESPLARDG